MDELKISAADAEWLTHFLKSDLPNDPPLISSKGSLFFLTGSGASLLINYLILGEARQSGAAANKLARRSLTIASVSLVLAVIVGIIQIVNDVMCH